MKYYTRILFMAVIITAFSACMQKNNLKTDNNTMEQTKENVRKRKDALKHIG